MINIDGLTQMVQDSPNYKVVVKRGMVHVIPAAAVEKIDFSKESIALEHNSDLVLRGDGRAKKSRWTNLAEDCPCEIKKRQEERLIEQQEDEDYDF